MPTGDGPRQLLGDRPQPVLQRLVDGTDYRRALLDAARLLLGALLSEDAPASGMR